MTDEQAVRAAIEARIEAMRRRDAAGANAWLADDIVAFELGGPLAVPAAQATDTAGFQAWLDSWETIDVEMRDLSIAAAGDVAFCHGFTRLFGVQSGGRTVDMWARSTLCLRRQEGRWKIVHGHTSVPFAMDGSFRAQVDLKP